jgi:hypothetical protein
VKTNRPLSLLACGVFPRSTESPTDHDQNSQPDSDPDQFAKPPEQHEGDAGDVGVTKGSQQEHIPAVLGAEAAGDEEGAAFDKDQERADGEAEGRKKDDAGPATIWRVV